MEVISLDQARHFLREKPIRTNVIDRPRLTCELVCMEAEQQDSRQSYDVSDNLYVVVEGACVVKTSASEFRLGLHDALVVPPGVEHTISNPGPDRLTVMAFVAPKPARASEVRFPRQQRDFSRPRREFSPRRDFDAEAPAADDTLISKDEEVAALLGEFAVEDNEGQTPEGGAAPRGRGEFRNGDREFRPRPPRREFSGGHESRGPRRDFSPGPVNDRPAYGGSRPPRRDFGPPRRDFSDRPAGDRPRGDRPPFSGGRPAGGSRPPYGGQQARGPRPFGNRPPPRRGFEGGAESEERGGRRPPVSRDFYPKKPNQTGGSKEFSARPASRGGPSRGGRPSPGAPRGAGPGASRGGGSPRPVKRPGRPPANRSGRPGPGRSAPRTSGRQRGP